MKDNFVYKVIGIVIVLAFLLFMQFGIHTNTGSDNARGYYHHNTSPSNPNEDEPPSNEPSSHPVTEP